MAHVYLVTVSLPTDTTREQFDLLVDHFNSHSDRYYICTEMAGKLHIHAVVCYKVMQKTNINRHINTLLGLKGGKGCRAVQQKPLPLYKDELRSLGYVQKGNEYHVTRGYCPKVLAKGCETYEAHLAAVASSGRKKSGKQSNQEPHVLQKVYKSCFDKGLSTTQQVVDEYIRMYVEEFKKGLNTHYLIPCCRTVIAMLEGREGRRTKAYARECVALLDKNLD